MADGAGRNAAGVLAKMHQTSRLMDPLRRRPREFSTGPSVPACVGWRSQCAELARPVGIQMPGVMTRIDWGRGCP
jgi:hypothetical protein